MSSGSRHHRNGWEHLVRLGYDRTRQFPRGSTWCGDHDGCAGGEKSKPFNHGYYHL